MRGFERLQAMSLELLIKLHCRCFNKCDKLMRLVCEGGLQYGWDWPTFAAMFPRRYQTKRAIMAEVIRKKRLKEAHGTLSR